MRLISGRHTPDCHSFGRYFSLFLVYTPYTIYQCAFQLGSYFLFLTSSKTDGFKGWGKLILKDGWKCMSSCLLNAFGKCKLMPIAVDFLLAACDVEGNFLVIKVCISFYDTWVSMPTA